MKLFSAALLALTISSLHAERDIVSVFQPLSLLGTELEATPLGKEEAIPADIFSTPTLVSSAYPEAIVQAISLPYHFYNSPEGFPKESNLIVLAGGHLDASWGEARHSITIDFSKVSLNEALGITLKQLCDLTLLCLSKSLQQGYTDGKSFDLIWKLPTAAKLDLPSSLQITQAEQDAAANP